jgi:hypothetical protein
MFAATVPTPHFKTYADISTAIVTTTDDPKGKGRSAIGFYIGTAGTVTLRPKGTTGSTDQTMTAAQGMYPGLEFDRISGSATNVTVYWSR